MANKIIIYDTYAGIILCNRKHEIVGEILIDIDDVNRIGKIRWYLNDNGYAMNRHFGRLHHLIMDFIPKENKPFVINHKSRNRLDCRKGNLEITTHQKNGENKGKQSNNTSGFPGISWYKARNKWEVYINVKNITTAKTKRFKLGYYDDIEEAKQARIDGELFYFGEIINRNNDIYTVFK